MLSSLSSNLYSSSKSFLCLGELSHSECGAASNILSFTFPHQMRVHLMWSASLPVSRPLGHLHLFVTVLSNCTSSVLCLCFTFIAVGRPSLLTIRFCKYRVLLCVNWITDTQCSVSDGFFFKKWYNWGWTMMCICYLHLYLYLMQLLIVNRLW